MKPPVIAVYSIKGGVGKTAAAVNLAYEAAESGRRVLLWDLDPQGASSFYFRIKPKIKGNARKLVMGKTDLSEQIKGSDFEGLDLLPADLSYRHFDIALDEVKKSDRQLAKRLGPVADDYDLVLLDCPPGLTLLAENVLHAADYMLVPVIPTTLSARTLEQLTSFCVKNGVTRLQIMPFLSMVDRRKTLHRQLLESLPEECPGFLDSSIPYASEVERMGVHRAPIGAFAARSLARDSFRALWDDVAGHL
ncbi:MAG: ParA family protein [Geminicoccaceae bacterium]